MSHKVDVLIISRGRHFSNHLAQCIKLFNQNELTKGNVVVFSIDKPTTIDNSVRTFFKENVPEFLPDSELESIALQTYFTTFAFPDRLLVIHDYEFIDIDKFATWVTSGANFESCASARFAAFRPFYKLNNITPQAFPSVIYTNLSLLNKGTKDAFRKYVIKPDQLFSKTIGRGSFFTSLQKDGMHSFEGVAIEKTPIVWDCQFVNPLEGLSWRLQTLGKHLVKDHNYELQFLFPDGNFVGVDIFGNDGYIVKETPEFLVDSVFTSNSYYLES